MKAIGILLGNEGGCRSGGGWGLGWGDLAIDERDITFETFPSSNSEALSRSMVNLSCGPVGVCKKFIPICTNMYTCISNV